MFSIASRPTLRESLAFTIEGTSVKVTIPRNVASREAGNAIIDQLVDAVRAALVEVDGLRDWRISIHAGDGQAWRGTVQVGAVLDLSKRPLTDIGDDIRRALHAAAAVVIKAVAS